MSNIILQSLDFNSLMVSRSINENPSTILGKAQADLEQEKKRVHETVIDAWKENEASFKEFAQKFTRHEFDAIHDYIDAHQKEGEALKEGEERYVRSSENLPRSLLYTREAGGALKIYVLFNKQSSDDHRLYGGKDNDQQRTTLKTIKTAWLWGTKEWFASASLNDPKQIKRAKEAIALVQKIEGMIPVIWMAEYPGKPSNPIEGEQPKKWRMLTPLGKCLFKCFKELSEDQKKHVFKQMVLTVCRLHEKGILHRDIKMENTVIILDKVDPKKNNPKVYLIDPEFACHEDDAVAKQNFCGSAWYLAPEYAQVGIIVEAAKKALFAVEDVADEDQMQEAFAKAQAALAQLIPVTTKAVDIFALGVAGQCLFTEKPAQWMHKGRKVQQLTWLINSVNKREGSWWPKQNNPLALMLKANPKERISSDNLKRLYQS